LVKRRDDAAGAGAGAGAGGGGAGGGAGRAGVEVYGLQIKSGRGDKHMTAGVLATELSRATRGVTDTTIAGVLVKAERGLSKLVLALRTCFVDVDFTLGRVIVFNTKPLGDDAVRKFVEAHRAHEFKLQLHTEAEPQTDDGVTALVTSGLSEFGWVVHGGDKWLRCILPAPLAGMLPPSHK
jgi:hypothetical protein